MTGGLSKNFHGVGIGPLSKILAVKYICYKTIFSSIIFYPINLFLSKSHCLDLELNCQKTRHNFWHIPGTYSIQFIQSQFIRSISKWDTLHNFSNNHIKYFDLFDKSRVIENAHRVTYTNWYKSLKRWVRAGIFWLEWFQYVYGTPNKMMATRPTLKLYNCNISTYTLNLHLMKVLSLLLFTERLYKASNIFM